MESVYLAPEAPRWTPRNETALGDAIRQGLLEESHYLDLKREMPAGGGHNKELARDLASFGVDGGTLIIGIEENKQARSLRLTPQPLPGLAERVEAVARTIPDPPLAVLCRPVASDKDPSVGYLVAHIPPSAVAPHMVDHKYLGRGDKAKQYLSDPEVRRLHDRHRATEIDGLTRLQRQFARDPVPPGIREQARLLLLAEPAAGRRGMLLDLVHGPGFRDRLSEFARAAGVPEIQQAMEAVGAAGFAPMLSWATDFALRSAGVALTYGLSGDRSPAADGGRSKEDMVELEVDEDGGLRIFMSRLSDRLPSDDSQPLFPAGAVSYARQFVALTAAAAEHFGYLGTWILAAGATGIGGQPVHDHPLRQCTQAGSDAPDYRRATSASYAELVQQPGTVTERLVGRLLRSLGVHDSYAQATIRSTSPS